ncbi:MAG: APC family permease [Verrucomicrobiae bacterium]
MKLIGFLKNAVIGRAHNLSDKKIFHNMSLIALLAWVGLGADGLSSSCYGPEAAFLALGAHTYLSLFVALASIVTIVVICASYSQIIELFPTGGGGYLVASKLLSPTAGVVSGAALLGDYVLTIALSVSSGADAIFSMLPEHYLRHKIGFSAGMVVFLTVLNLRGVKESIVLWVPVFFVFVGTYTFGIIWAIATHFGDLPQIMHGVTSDVHATYIDPQIGLIGMLAVMLRAYGLGAGTYTGIEAVSNAVNTLREPRVQTGKRTMVYMATSLSFVVGGLLLAYLLYHVTPVEGKTLNAVLFEKLTAEWPVNLSKAFVIAAMGSSAALLVIAAQTGFVGGPRVLANMAVDRWMPTRFATLSDRLVTQNGVVIMGIAALLIVVFTSAAVNIMVVLYSINVFVTFSLSQLGMVRHWWQVRATQADWKKKISINGIGLLLTGGILLLLCVVKFDEGGWATLLVTGVIVALAFWVKAHYKQTQKKLHRLNELVAAALADDAIVKEKTPPPCDVNARTAVFLVNGFNGLGLHTLLAVVRMFPKVYDNYVFLQVGVLDAGNFKGADEVENLREHSQKEVQRFVTYMSKRGFYTEAHIALGTDIVEEAAKLCEVVAEKFPQAQFFAGQLVFKDESFATRWLHNHTVFELQRRLYQNGRAMLILPIQV